MKKIINNDKTFNILVMILILVQPFLDMYKAYAKFNIQIFGISLIEVINFLLVGGVLIITIIKNFSLIKEKKWFFIIIGIVYTLYIILHTWNILNFNKSLFAKNEINVFIEIYYIIRAYLLMLLLMLCLLINGFKKETFYKTLNIFTITITFIIVISNVLNVAYVAYSDTIRPIEGNVFTWFTFSGSYFKSITSKGLFFSANQLSNLLLFLLPISIINAFKSKSPLMGITVFMHILAMFMLGTKVATIGSVGICLGFIFLRLIMVIKEKKLNTNCVKIYLAFVLSTPFLWFSPLLQEIRYNMIRQEEKSNITIENAINDYEKDEKNDKNEIKKIKDKYNELAKKNPNKKVEININLDFNKYAYASLKLIGNSCEEIARDKDIIDYMKANNSIHKISNLFVDNYPIDNDPEFWCEKYKHDANINLNSRQLKNDMFNRIIDLNNRTLDKFLGVGYTLNMLDTETDYLMQYFQFGIVGAVLFIFPYIICLIGGAIYVLKNLTKRFTTENILLLVSLFCGLGSAYFCGHLYSYSITMFPLTLIASVIYLYMIKNGGEE